MVGAALVIIAVVVVLPSLLCISGGVVAALLGEVSRRSAERAHADSELLDLNR
jgi:hypothetical protein